MGQPPAFGLQGKVYRIWIGQSIRRRVHFIIFAGVGDWQMPAAEIGMKPMHGSSALSVFML